MKKYFKIAFGLTTGYLVAKGMVEGLSRWAITVLRKSKLIMEATDELDPNLSKFVREL